MALAKKHHPDRAITDDEDKKKEAHDRFAGISAAFDTLGDTFSRYESSQQFPCMRARALSLSRALFSLPLSSLPLSLSLVLSCFFLLFLSSFFYKKNPEREREEKRREEKRERAREDAGVRVFLHRPIN